MVLKPRIQPTPKGLNYSSVILSRSLLLNSFRVLGHWVIHSNGLHPLLLCVIPAGFLSLCISDSFPRRGRIQLTTDVIRGAKTPNPTNPEGVELLFRNPFPQSLIKLLQSFGPLGYSMQRVASVAIVCHPCGIPGYSLSLLPSVSSPLNALWSRLLKRASDFLRPWVRSEPGLQLLPHPDRDREIPVL